MFQANQIIGPYTLIQRIGRGGFGEVWLAERRTALLTNEVAVKLPLDDQVDLETIKKEASLWKQASGHPNVLPIIEANIYEEQVVIVSEYAPDGSLGDILKQKGKLPIKEAVELTTGILAGLEFLHSRQIIHRDLKPANILLQNGIPRLTDFGISRAMVATQTSQSVNITGTPPYMAPEAFDGKRNMQTDIWSVGVISYYLLAGHLPFPQQDITSLIGAIAGKNPASLPESIPEVLRNVVMGALAKNPELRFKSAAEMHDALKGKKSLATRSIAVHDDVEVETVVMPKPRRIVKNTAYGAVGKANNTKEIDKWGRRVALRRTLKTVFGVIFALVILSVLFGFANLIIKKLEEGKYAEPQASKTPAFNRSVTTDAFLSPTPSPKTPKPSSTRETEIPLNENSYPPSNVPYNRQPPSNLKPARNFDQEMLNAAAGKALQLHNNSKIENYSSINNGQYDQTYIFLMRGKILGIRRFRVAIRVVGQANGYVTQVIENREL